ncbi:MULTISPECIES: ATP synthase subunit I [unclassified Prochlorococcus]|uniref:ATP synthase subunit I n=1 Tax=unclassified Prochlorococcus TaxID=2627481 RepID=UPI00053373F1|nr:MULTISPECIES: ATP synthase subunit I [unclassified Prochlorococcus]KGG14782.1 hypothetical protein EV06_1845 [Prochlorococcus sp. MIT 0602]
MLASPRVTSVENSPIGEESICAHSGTSKNLNPSIDLESPEITSRDLVDEYVSLQLRIFRMTLFVTALSVLFTISFFGTHAAFSLLIGAFSGILYLRLLAKSIGSLGKTSSSVSKVQLIVPVLLVLVIAKLPGLDLTPALVGFLLYKPSLIFQFLIEPSA